jgi:hypothetical protein
VVAPVNHRAAVAITLKGTAQEVWAQERLRWEVGHLIGWLFHLAALFFLATMIYKILSKNIH